MAVGVEHDRKNISMFKVTLCKTTYRFYQYAILFMLTPMISNRVGSMLNDCIEQWLVIHEPYASKGDFATYFPFRYAHRKSLYVAYVHIRLFVDCHNRIIKSSCKKYVY